jgi:hypothetical protein
MQRHVAIPTHDSSALEAPSRPPISTVPSFAVTSLPRQLVRYLGELTTPRLILWCYLIWWVSAAAHYFDPNPRLWLTSLGISAIIGTALYLSTAHAGKTRTRLDGWQVFRFYLMPFCVSSFAALVKDRGFVLVFHPSVQANVEALSACAGFWALCYVLRRLASVR